jgi:DNA-binding transcriptional MerR regulator
MQKGVMSERNDTTYMPIGEVVALLQRDNPDVSHSSLRFLEREGLLRATRTPGGHRLYSEADIDRIRRIKQWQSQHLSLDEIRERLGHLDRMAEPGEIANEVLTTALAGNLDGARQAVLRLDEIGLPIERIFGEVLAPALYEVGARWESGALPVAQEKEISELARELVAELTLRHAHPAPAGPVVVAGCVEGEDHELGLRMICGLLRAEGYRVHYLGADVAPRFLLEAMNLHRPALVMLSAKLGERLPALREAMAIVRAGDANGGAPRLIVGGDLALDHREALEEEGSVTIVTGGPAAALGQISGVLPPRNSTH